MVGNYCNAILVMVSTDGDDGGCVMVLVMVVPDCKVWKFNSKYIESIKNARGRSSGRGAENAVW